MIVKIEQRIHVSVYSCRCGLFRLAFESGGMPAYFMDGLLRFRAGSCEDPSARLRKTVDQRTGAETATAMHRWHPQNAPDARWFDEALEGALQWAVQGYVERSAQELPR